MTDKQLIIMLSLLKAKISVNNKAMLDKLGEDKLGPKYFPMLIQNEVVIADMIDTLKPTIKICRCGTEMDGKFKLCNECRKVRGFSG